MPKSWRPEWTLFGTIWIGEFTEKEMEEVRRYAKENGLDKLAKKIMDGEIEWP